MKYFSIFLCAAVLVASASARKAVARFQTAKSITPRIIGGQPALAGQYPSAAAVYTNTQDGTYFCGGSLISQEFVLTASNCIVNGLTFQVLLGSTTLQGTDPNRETLSTSLFFLHPEFDPNTLQHDVGLIRFHLPVEYNDYIKPVYLPTVELIDNLDNTAIGWGQVSDSTAGVSNELITVRVATIPNAECQLSYANTIFDTMVCVAGNFNEGTCRGDNGSPLMTTLNHHHWHVGIASFISSNGCESADPSGYTRTFSYIDWIKTTAEIA